MTKEQIRATGWGTLARLVVVLVSMLWPAPESTDLHGYTVYRSIKKG
ncbi:MAG: hypothetical protein VCA55_14775 [Verrucomicrobiales bacterium]